MINNYKYDEEMREIIEKIVKKIKEENAFKMLCGCYDIILDDCNAEEVTEIKQKLAGRIKKEILAKGYQSNAKIKKNDCGVEVDFTIKTKRDSCTFKVFIVDCEVDSLKNIDKLIDVVGNEENSLLIIIHDYDKKTAYKNVIYLNFVDSNLYEPNELIEGYIHKSISMRDLNALSRVLYKNNENLMEFCRQAIFEQEKYFIFFVASRKTLQLTSSQYIFLKSVYNGMPPKIINNENRKLLEMANGLIEENIAKNILIEQSEHTFINQSQYNLSFVGDGKCNMACKYCFSDHECKEFESSDLSVDVMRKSLDFIINKTEVKPTLICVDFMIASEPLIKIKDYFKLVEICRAYEKRHKIRIQLGFLTNGTLLTDEILDVFNKDIQWLGFSIDGDKKTHDEMRVFHNGQGSYDIIEKNVDKIMAMNWFFTPGVSVVITANNMDLMQIFSHLWNKGFRAIIMRPVRTKASNKYSINRRNISDLEFQYTILAEFLLSKVREGDFNYLKAILFETDYLGRFLIRTFLNKRIYLKHCAAGISYFSVRNNGEIYSCDSLNSMGISKVGDVDNGFTSSFKVDTVFEMERCKNCWAKFMCGGPCSHLIHLDENNEIISVECELNKFLIKLSITFWEHAKQYISYENHILLEKYIKDCNHIIDSDNDFDFAYGPR